MDKLGRIEKFIESLDIEDVSENKQTLLLIGDMFGSSGSFNVFCIGDIPNNGCTNWTVCEGVNQSCTNTGIC
jgi:hypothetical protein